MTFMQKILFATFFLSMTATAQTNNTFVSIPTLTQLNLRNKGEINLNNGVLSFIDLHRLTQDMIKTMHERLQQGPSGLLNQPKQLVLSNYAGETPFNQLRVHYKIPKANNNLNFSLLLQTTQLNINSQGNINLLTRAIDAKLWVNIITTDPTVNTLQQLFGNKIPFIITGTLEQPALYLNQQQLNTFILQSLSNA